MSALLASVDASSPRDAGEPDFAQGVSTSPDGSCVLYWTERQRIALLEVTRACGSPEGADALAVGLKPALGYHEGDRIHGCAWWPLMSSADPSSCVFVSSSKDQPIHLWDAYTGALRTSYCAYDHTDEPTTALSLAFVTGSAPRLVAGYNRVGARAAITLPGDLDPATTRPWARAGHPRFRHAPPRAELLRVRNVGNEALQARPAVGVYDRRAAAATRTHVRSPYRRSGLISCLAADPSRAECVGDATRRDAARPISHPRSPSSPPACSLPARSAARSTCTQPTATRWPPSRTRTAKASPAWASPATAPCS